MSKKNFKQAKYRCAERKDRFDRLPEMGADEHQGRPIDREATVSVHHVDCVKDVAVIDLVWALKDGPINDLSIYRKGTGFCVYLRGERLSKTRIRNAYERLVLGYNY